MLCKSLQLSVGIIFSQVCILQCSKTFKTVIASTAEEQLVLVSSNMNMGFCLIFCRHILKTSVHILDTSLNFCASLHVFHFFSEVQIYETQLKTVNCHCTVWQFLLIHRNSSSWELLLCILTCTSFSEGCLVRCVYSLKGKRNTFFIPCPHKSRSLGK